MFAFYSFIAFIALISTPTFQSLQIKNSNKLNIFKEIKQFSIILTTSICLTTLPLPSHALEASKLYAQAEQAIQITQKEYKGVEDNWLIAKKSIIESSKNLGKNSELIKGTHT